MENGDRSLELFKLEKSFKAGAGWFFWIAGLSLINSIIILSGKNWSFIVGLGITQVVDMVAREIGAFGKVAGLVLDVAAAGVFVVFGLLSYRRYSWAFVVGMVIYGLDGLIFLLAMDFLSLGFHAFALVCIFSGLRSLKKLKLLESQAAPVQPAPQVPPQPLEPK